ncbi:MAG: homoserine dehydrogenase [Peptostreptococcaceae bacterium]|nr:homoserine dehydrogenase [Peptostreptococcaceae bacterium]
MNNIKIAILGVGNVGSGVWKILHKNQRKVDSYLGRSIDIKKVLVNNVNKKRDIDIPADILTEDFAEILENKDIQVVVELIGGLEPAYSYIKAALKNKKHVVTANKAVIATYGKELRELADENEVEIRYEASVGGGIPIINTLIQSLSANKFDEIIGIVNGTTNYILTQMTAEGMDFDEALKLAQEKGFAESDPTSDIEGEDAAFKLSILSYIAFGIEVSPQDIPREGISKISREDIEYAKQLGYTIKLLATARKNEKTFECHVHPVLLKKDHPLSSVNNEFNALYVRGNAVGELMLYGKGAGSMPTGSAVLGDVMEIGKRISEKPSVSHANKNEYISSLESVGEGLSEYYIRFQVKDQPGVLGNIATIMGEYGISLQSVVQRGKPGEKLVPLVFITHEVSRKNLNSALEKIKASDAIEEVASIIKVRR